MSFEGDANGRQNSSRSSSPESKAAKIDRNFTRCIILVFAVLAFAILLPVLFSSSAFLPPFAQRYLEQILHSLGLEPRVHAVVIDAGSTGSRVLAFTFKHDFLNGNQLKLVDELWKQVKPGLSSFAEEPVKAGQSVAELLAAAKERIPAKYWSSTPITLKATAGLRLLPAAQSEAIINEVKKVLQSSGFQTENTADEKLIEIMNPMEEGLFAWFTVNYLLDAFKPGKLLWQSAASLDLGGGSTQITFAPKKFPVEGIEGRKHFIHQVDIVGNEPWQVYSHSYLGLGLMAAREAIFEAEGSSKSSCILSPVQFSFHGKNFQIGQGEAAGFEACLQVIKSVIQTNDVHQPDELQGRDLVAFSYFYDLAVEAGLISGLQGSVTIADYKKAALKACQNQGNPGNDFACLDMTFLYGLLNQGYGLPESKLIHLYKKINGHEASWALGVGYHMIHNQ